MRVTLDDWNEQYFAKPRTRKSLYNYIREGKIQPPPIKVGRSYEVEKDAVFVNDWEQIPYSVLERINGQKKEKRK